MDAFTDVLRSLRLRNFKPALTERRAPWGVYNTPKAWDVIFYAIKGESCWLTVESVPEPILLTDKSIVVLPHGNAYILQDMQHTPPFSTAEMSKRRPPGYYGFVQQGGTEGPATLSLYGGFALEQNGQNPLWSALPTVIHIPCTETPSWLEPTFEWICQELTESRPGHYSVVSHLAELLIIQSVRMYIERLDQDRAGWLASLQDPVLVKALNLIHSQLGHRWTLETLAGSVGMSRSRFTARFSKSMGQGPIHYLAFWRMQRAASLLRDTKLALSDIIQAVGYESEPSFNMAFKRLFGMPPGRYRRDAKLRMGEPHYQA